MIFNLHVLIPLVNSADKDNRTQKDGRTDGRLDGQLFATISMRESREFSRGGGVEFARVSEAYCI